MAKNSVVGLIARFYADSKPFAKGMESAANTSRQRQIQINRYQKKIEQGFKKVSAATQNWSKQLLSVRSVVATLAGTGGIGYLIKNTAKANAALLTISESTGASTNLIQSLRLEFEKFGLEGEKADDILYDLNERIGELKTNGGGVLGQFFKDLGATQFIDDIQKVKDTDKALELVLNQFNGLDKQQLSFAGADALTGSANETIGALRHIAQVGVPNVVQAYLDGGLIIENADVFKLAALNSKFAEITANIKTKFSLLVADNADIINTLTDKIINLLELAGGYLPTATDKITGFFEYIVDNHKVILSVLAGLKAFQYLGRAGLPGLIASAGVGVAAYAYQNFDANTQPDEFRDAIIGEVYKLIDSKGINFNDSQAIFKAQYLDEKNATGNTELLAAIKQIPVLAELLTQPNFKDIIPGAEVGAAAAIDNLTNKIPEALDSANEISAERVLEIRSTWEGMFNKLTDSLVQFSRTGEFEFKKFADGVLNDILRLTIKQNISDPLSKQAVPFLTDLAASIFAGAESAGSGSATSTSTSTTFTPPAIPGHAGGGAIYGAGTGTSDSIPAFLSNGEYVLQASAVKKIGVNNLDRLNKIGMMTHFNTGGSAGMRSNMIMGMVQMPQNNFYITANGGAEVEEGNARGNSSGGIDQEIYIGVIENGLSRRYNAGEGSLFQAINGGGGE